MGTQNDGDTGDKQPPSSRDGDAAGGGDSAGAGNILAGEQDKASGDDDGGPKRNETPSSPDTGRA